MSICMIDWARLNWHSILDDVLFLFLNRNQDAIFRLGQNIAVQLINQISKIETIDENFIQELKNSMPQETEKIRFTNEGGFVRE